MALLSMRDVSHSFSGPPLLDQVNLQIEHGERVCLLGRNGTGKTTLMRIILGDIPPDKGEIARQQGLRVAYLAQQVPKDLAGTVYDEVAGGLGEWGNTLAEYHRVSNLMAAEGGDGLAGQLDRIHHALDTSGGWLAQQKVDREISRLGLDPDAEVASLSAGLKRRTLLAKALVCDPDILLLDEPTNHLDITAITWLEDFLKSYDGTLLFVTHDRMFLRKLATRILELDRGCLTSWACDHETYLERKQATLDAEAGQNALFDRKLAQEEAWIRQGIKARRTRNMGRVRALQRMRDERRQRRERSGMVRMQTQQAERSGRLVIDASGVDFSYGDEHVIRGLTTTILRGDKVGIIGPNGSGKTTLLRVLLGELPPNAGKLRHGTKLEIAYFDQLHAQLDENKSVQENVGLGSELLTIHGKTQHILGYLKDFLFTPERARSPVSFLSGGERNRLLLARLFSTPSNVLVLDEPTNDLDTETLELLEERLVEYDGTVLLVSHDRDFLNNVVTSTLVLEGEGIVKEYAGGYDDWLFQRKQPEPVQQEKAAARPEAKAEAAQRPRKLTYNEQRELDALPGRIEELEAQLQRLHEAMSDPAFYQSDRGSVTQAASRLKDLEQELEEAYHRWEELEERSTG